MRRKVAYLIVICMLYTLHSAAQELSAYLPESSGETVVLQCDREIYGAGELIHYYVSYQGPEWPQTGSWSSVAYVELISWDGSKRSSSKVPIRDNGARGTIRIPEKIPSGVFYLRAYTRWMRNYSPLSYAYLPLKILNPYSLELQSGPLEGELEIQAREYPADGHYGNILLRDFRDQYDTRQRAEFEILVPEELTGGLYSLNIAKTPGMSSSDYEWNRGVSGNAGSEQIEFLPEISGLTLSGRIIDTESNEAVDNARLQLSSYADPFLYAEILSGKDGGFHFSFPVFSGNPELHISEASDSADSYEILLTSEFCNRPVQLPFVSLQIDSSEQSVAREILINSQLSERYKEPAEGREYRQNSQLPFYGDGASVTHVKDYIELKDLRELIYEIIPQVSIRSNGEGSRIIIQGPDCLEIYPPLVLLDNVPVLNNDNLLNIPGNRIERIEVLNRGYMVGNTRYSGIFSIYSTRKDMAGMERQGRGNFFNLQMLDETVQHVHIKDPAATDLPLIANLLYWEQNVRFSGEGSFRVQFFAPDSPGSYVLTLRGSEGAEGYRVLYMKKFVVK